MRNIYGEPHEGSDRLIGRNNQIDYQINGSIRWTWMATVMKNELTTSLTEQLQQHQGCLLRRRQWWRMNLQLHQLERERWPIDWSSDGYISLPWEEQSWGAWVDRPSRDCWTSTRIRMKWHPEFICFMFQYLTITLMELYIEWPTKEGQHSLFNPNGEY